ncbi:Protein-export membrane protein SecD/SecF, archaeal and bacterial [Acididesulfobacillus acetoxydans]|uniref:Protein export membrane protein n=1 Tax=Acididesulfobacillus acetoxydans TaxID=1561005 RepID=A0A8S0WQ12_9FIRM|nr:Protein-export membrane protein SecD/SecF, archaeal and bacterial [Acididesulfobacillus acetoxydans]CEJ08769.1 Protein export membrane protein [Acididesulfobacillus acetoxydans]
MGTIRFQFSYAISGIIALVHDVLVALGIFSLFQWQVDATFVAAILTIFGYFINDTVITVLIALFSVYILGGASTKIFALAMLIGVFSGAYSSIFNASQILVEIKKQ